MVRLAAVFAFVSTVGAARVHVGAAEEAAVVAEATVKKESVEEDEEQWTCPIGRRVRNPFGGRCAMVISADGSRCTIQYDDGSTDRVHSMHLDEDERRCPQPTTTTTTTTTTTRHWMTEPSLVVADGCPASMGLQNAQLRPAMTGRGSVRCCSMAGDRCETQTVGCLRGVSFFEANAHCHAHGLRLCSRQELDGGVCCGTGCGFDGRRIWTFTPELFPNPAVLRNVGSGRRIYAEGGQNGASGVGAAGTGEIHDDQLWIIEDAGHGQFTIANADNGRRLFAQRDHGRAVGAFIGHDHADQTWNIEPTEGGAYIITNAHSGRRLFARGDGNWGNGFGAADGERVWPDQTWLIEPVTH